MINFIAFVVRTKYCSLLTTCVNGGLTVKGFLFQWAKYSSLTKTTISYDKCCNVSPLIMKHIGVEKIIRCVYMIDQCLKMPILVCHRSVFNFFKMALITFVILELQLRLILIQWLRKALKTWVHDRIFREGEGNISSQPWHQCVYSNPLACRCLLF